MSLLVFWRFANNAFNTEQLIDEVGRLFPSDMNRNNFKH